MGRVADQQQPVAVPAPQPFQAHVEQLHVVPRPQVVDPVGHPGQQGGEPTPQLLDPGRPQRGVAALADEVGALPVVATVDQHAEVPRREAADPAGRVVLAPRQPEPPHVHRHAERPRPQARRRPHRRAAPVARDRHRRPQLVLDPGLPVDVPDARDPVPVPQQVLRLGVAAQRERRLLLGDRREHVEQIPLRHQRDVLMGARQRPQVGDREAALVELHLHPVQEPVRDLFEALAEAELVEQGEGGGVHGVAAEVAQEVGVLLQHGDLDARAGHEQAEDHPGRSAPDDEAGRAPVIRHMLNLARTDRRRQPPACCGPRGSARVDVSGPPRNRRPVGYGVIGSTTDSGSVSLGSSPGTPAKSPSRSSGTI